MSSLKQSCQGPVIAKECDEYLYMESENTGIWGGQEEETPEGVEIFSDLECVEWQEVPQALPLNSSQSRLLLSNSCNLHTTAYKAEFKTKRNIKELSHSTSTYDMEGM